MKTAMPSSATETNHEFEALLDFLKRNRGFDFTGYKRASLVRRVKKRMQEVQIGDYLAYLDYLKANPDEFTFLFNTILINVTGFFRDPDAWEFLVQEIVPKIEEKSRDTGRIRAWCPGSASGEEAYTLTMILAEALGEEVFLERVKIYATDADEEALIKARHGQYKAKEVENIPPYLLEKYFEKQGSLYSFRKNLRRALIFGRHDLVQDAPISRIDLLTCRNVLMYFNSEAQSRVLSRIHFALNENGFIFLGKAEMLLSYANYFAPVNLRYRIFKKVSDLNSRDSLLAMSQSPSRRSTTNNQNAIHMYEQLFETNQNAHIVLDGEGNLAIANKPARDLFSLSIKDYGQLFHNFEVSYRPVDLRTPISKAFVDLTPVTLNEIAMRTGSGPVSYYDVNVIPLLGTDRNLLGVDIVFIETTSQKALLQQMEHTTQELETAMEELQSTNEELETTNEELQSTIEELETTNEELQSANEELETMNEELQSTNQEIETVNEQLHQRNEDFNQVNVFLNTILESISGSVIVLDPQLRVTIWSLKSEDLWGLRASEAQNQHFLNLDIGLPVDMLKRPIRQCLADHSKKEAMTLTARNRRGKDISCNVVITPLIGLQENVEGVILIIEERGG